MFSSSAHAAALGEGGERLRAGEGRARALLGEFLLQRGEQFGHVPLLVPGLHGVTRPGVSQQEHRRAQAHVRAARHQIERRGEIVLRHFLPDEQKPRVREKERLARRLIAQTIHRQAQTRGLLRQPQPRLRRRDREGNAALR